jgi:hypothetical protein
METSTTDSNFSTIIFLFSKKKIMYSKILNLEFKFIFLKIKYVAYIYQWDLAG